MGSRYSRINDGGDLKFALDNLQAYRAGDKQTRRRTGQGTVSSRGSQQDIGVIPFGYKLDGTHGTGIVRAVVSESALETAAANFDTIANFGTGTDARVEFTPDPANYEAARNQFRPAKVIAFKRDTSKQPSYKQSKSTKLYYISYPGKSYSCAFGRKQSADGATESEFDAYLEVKTTVKASLGDGGRCSIQEETWVES